MSDPLTVDTTGEGRDHEGTSTGDDPVTIPAGLIAEGAIVAGLRAGGPTAVEPALEHPDLASGRVLLPFHRWAFVHDDGDSPRGQPRPPRRDLVPEDDLRASGLRGRRAPGAGRRDPSRATG